ncbi:ABC transporter substrate-binding protein [Nocardia higoensis]|uniref:ABC transporter substrate-binding protein n=1 Tax=Nocardia higoensis TaxID=228599 RepID=UPI0002E8AD26|nr:extracellular solute-binding protein [Nocardia higoensis]
MKKLRKAATAVAALATVALAAACGGSPSSTGPVDGTWDDVVAAANDEGKVLLYTSQKPANLQVLEKEFEAAYPRIDLEFVRGTDPDITPRVETENRTGRGSADVHMTTDAGWIAAAAESGAYSTDLLSPSLDAPEFRAENGVLNGRFVLSSAAVFAMGWNTDAVPGGLSSPLDLLDPRFQGKVGIVNPTGIASYVDLYRHYAKTYGEDYWQKLAALKPRVYPSALGIAQALSSGEIIATPSVQPLVTEVAAGAPVGWKLPEKPWGTPWYTHALKVAPHPNAAQLLVDFIATPAGQIALNSGYASVLPDVPGAVARAADITLPDTTDLTPQKVDEYSQQWSRLFQS